MLTANPLTAAITGLEHRDKESHSLKKLPRQTSENSFVCISFMSAPAIMQNTLT